MVFAMTANLSHNPVELAEKITACFQCFTSVQAVVLGGSQSTGKADAGSDIDLYVFTSRPISVETRAGIIDAAGASLRELNQTYWDTCDEWFDSTSGIKFDLMYWDPVWIEDQLARVLERHEASLGYTTAFWYTMLNATILYDKNGWMRAIQESCRRPYPDALRRNIIAKNHPLLRRAIPSYRNQILKAVTRNDPVSVSHRLAALLASYFDVLFALNCQPHPGEKRLLDLADELEHKPNRMKDDMLAVLEMASPEQMESLPGAVEKLIDGMDELLLTLGFDPQTSQPAG